MNATLPATEAYAADIRAICRLEQAWRDKRSLNDALRLREALRVRCMKSHGVDGWVEVLKQINED